MASSRFTRRDFLSATSLAAASLALPQILPSGVLAARGQPGANDRIGLGFIGIGRQASGLLGEFLKLSQARYVAVADVNMKRARESATKHKAVAFQDFRRLLERKDVDAIVTATPEHWRLHICVMACQAEKHVYAEKPMTLTIREGRLMVQAARKYNCVFQVGSQQRSQWQNYTGCELIRKGGIGKVSKVVCYNYPSPWECALPEQPIPDELDWEMWCGPNPKVPFNQDLYLPRANPGWLSFRPYSGGEMTGWGAHGFDQIQCALGMDDTGPVEIWPEGGKFDPPTYTKPEPKERGDKICSVPKVSFRYANGVLVEPGAEATMGGAVFYGEKGRVAIARGKCESDPDELAIDALRKRPADFNDNHQKNWLNAIKSRTKPIADVEIGHRSSTVCHLCNIARWTGRKLKWDPVKEEFIGDADANKFLDRERRKPWTTPEKI